MKKIISAVLVVVSLLATITLTACGKFVCDGCGEEKSGKKHTQSIFGEEIVICDDCYDEIDDIFG